MSIVTRLFGKKKEYNLADDLEYQNRLHEIKFASQLRQRTEDFEIKCKLRAEVTNYLIRQNNLSQQYDFECPLPRFWMSYIYVIHDEETAQFKEKGSLDKFREDYFLATQKQAVV